MTSKRHERVQKPALVLTRLSNCHLELYTTSEIIAEFAQVSHHAIQQLIVAYESDLKEFGRVAFEMRACPHRTGASVQKIYRLNEPQSTLLMTFLKNTSVVVAFKKELVHQFYDMRALVLEQSSPIWQDTRSFGKEIRRMETDAIKKLVDYATAQGSQNANHYYTILAKLANSTAGILDRATAQAAELTTLHLIEQVIARGINAGIQAGTPYKAIYQGLTTTLSTFSTLIPCGYKIGQAH